ncbi:hypothetical protein, partial [Mesorhizobium sp.]|uniref:hypothetical protein n=1 Tax=Mesorhizobium sp. TaxID=1871066 RepID=UPI0033901BFD
ARFGSGKPDVRSRNAACDRIAEMRVTDLDVGQALVTGKREKRTDVKAGRRHVIECKAGRYLAHCLTFLP